VKCLLFGFNSIGLLAALAVSEDGKGGAMAEDERQDEPKVPKLESRKNRDPHYGDDPKRADRGPERTDQDSQAFYLIEREAIQLRRRRWQAFANTTEMFVRDTPAPTPSLAQYERREKIGKPESRLTRLRKRVSRAFRNRLGGVDER